jgi:hypothetical protein
MANPIRGDSDQQDTPGVTGFSAVSDGTRGDTGASAKNGVVGGNESSDPIPSGAPGGNGVFGFSTNPQGSGVLGSNNATGAVTAPGGSGVFGITKATGGAGVFGANLGTSGRGVQGNGPEAGVAGFSDQGVGVLAQSTTVALKAQGPLAGRFEGNVEVTGDITLVNADCAEDFAVAIAGTLEPGTVVICDADGALRPSISPYDKKVVGVVSGAGPYKPAIVLDRQDSLQHRAPVALLGKVFCKVDAEEYAIEVGDLLTTSSSAGHAMKASDPSRAFGAVIGKALRPLASGRGKIPVLVALQ